MTLVKYEIFVYNILYRLKPSKVLAISQLRDDILYSCKVRKAYKCEKEARQLYIAKPIILNKHIERSNKDDYNTSSDEYEDNKMINKEGIKIIYQDDEAKIESKKEEEERQWYQFIDGWIKLENREDQFEDKKDYIFFSSE
ncbi:hypothetical protein F8M41_010811 [Gigaspora margarita]|uniref:Uncharacterized protein n=1 Tax=Gigaspora margarita TaxID=4874 RepID=A0A8H3X2Z8_GIGMA|nr:hypothetical protein F8M41_010811 [Gigaspora margarita]